ncbi:MAG: sodium/proton-translocating pyrophosphatase, partial [Planctomycetes bacterium]|nr:sodium/proton-translocating pyrophosphatase [Planctomycetota bacterium]
FARVCGVIYTKSADVGSDLVGKLEAGIPADDPRNPATIADNVGDNVGDVAGMGADLYESYAGSILATAALGVAAVPQMRLGEGTHTLMETARVMGERTKTDLHWWDPDFLQTLQLKFLAAPMVVAAVGTALSIIFILLVRTGEKAGMRELLNSLMRAVLFSSIGIAIAAWFVIDQLGLPHGIAWAIWCGLFAGVVIGKTTEYYTAHEHPPTRGIAKQSEMGAATVIIDGIAVGMMSTGIPVITIGLGMILAFVFAGGLDNPSLGLYGVGIAAVGMLSTLGLTLATDAYGPIADNAGGNAEMAGLEKEVRKRTDALDALGNTTAATGKGFAIGSAALTALALLAAYLEEIRVYLNNGEVAAAVTEAADHGKLLKADPATAAGRDNTAVMAAAAREADFKDAHVRVKTEVEKVAADREAAGHKEEAARLRDQLAAFDTSSATEGTVSSARLNALPAEQQQLAVALIPFAQQARKTRRSVVTEHDLAAATNRETIQERLYVGAGSASPADFMARFKVDLLNPKVLVGMFLGAMSAFFFCALTMKAVGRAAGAMVEEVRRQFRTIAGLMEGTARADYARCVDISTRGAQREMVLPSMLAVALPVATGVLLGVPGVIGLLGGALVCGFVLAVMMATSGGAWDNAKKYVEEGHYGGKGSPAHKAAVVGDTVGDPFKDTSGPSLNILIKLMSMVAIVFAGLTVKVNVDGDRILAWLGKFLN